MFMFQIIVIVCNIMWFRGYLLAKCSNIQYIQYTKQLVKYSCYKLIVIACSIIWFMGDFHYTINYGNFITASLKKYVDIHINITACHVVCI